MSQKLSTLYNTIQGLTYLIKKSLETSNFSFFHHAFSPFRDEYQNMSHNLFSESAFNPLPDDKILDWSKLKQSEDNNFEFDVNSNKFSKLVENTVGKGEIACYKKFLLPQCFHKGLLPSGVRRCHCMGMG